MPSTYSNRFPLNIRVWPVWPAVAVGAALFLLLPVLVFAQTAAKEKTQRRREQPNSALPAPMRPRVRILWSWRRFCVACPKARTCTTMNQAGFMPKLLFVTEPKTVCAWISRCTPLYLPRLRVGQVKWAPRKRSRINLLRRAGRCVFHAQLRTHYRHQWA